MDGFQPSTTSGSSTPAGRAGGAASWSPAPGLIDGYPVRPRTEPASPSRQTISFDAAALKQSSRDAFAQHPRARAQLPDSFAALAEAEYVSAVADLRGLAAVECALAGLKARMVERIDAAATRLGEMAELDRWQREILGIATAAELSTALTLPPQAGSQLSRQCTQLVRQHGDCLAALEAGTLTWRNALIVLENYDSIADLTGTDGAPLVAEGQLRQFEHQLLSLAPGMTSAKFSVQARRLRERTHPASIEARHLKASAERRLVLMPDRDGMSWLSLFLPADTAQGLWNTATRAARALQGPGEHRSLTQLRVDVLAERCLAGGGPATATTRHDQPERPRPQAQVLVTVPLLTLLGHGDEVADLEGYGPIPPSMARELAAGSATLYRIMVDPVSNEYLAMDPHRYRITGVLRTLLRARDGTCVFPGCNTVTDDTELDHLLAWQSGGGSSPANLASECGVHHRLKHFKDGKDRNGQPGAARPPSGHGSSSQVLQGWRPDRPTADGDRPGWTSPAGQHYPPPAPLVTPARIPPAILQALAAEREQTQPPEPTA